jgi:hypothetical protein
MPTKTDVPAGPRFTISVLLVEIPFLILALAIHPQKPLFVEVTGEGELRSHTQSTGDVAFTLSAGAFHTFKFVVPSDHTDASLKGTFSVTGRRKSKVEAFVLNEGDYKSWLNGDTKFRVYDSGNVRQGSMDVSFPVDTGTYYVVFNNRSPVDAPTSVRAKMRLFYYSRWWPGMPQ